MGNLKFFPPKKEGDKTYIYPPDTVVEEGISLWKSSLVGQFMDKSLPYFLVKKAVTAMWSQYGEVEVFSLENGMYIFRLKDEATCDEILESKIWHVSNKPLILRKWKPGMQVLKLALSSVPVWVKFLHLPMEFWTSNGLSYVASGVGVPLYANKVTEEQKRLGFAKVLIENDVHSACPKELIICRANGDSVTVGVVYSWLPPKCSTCGTFGHATYTCNKKEQKVWVPKKINNSPHKKPSLGAKLTFDRTISKPGIGSKPKDNKGEIRLSNSFARLSQDERFEEEDKPRTPTTFLQVFEKAMSDKGKGILEASPARKGWKVINNYSKHCLGKIWICWDPGGVKIDVVNVHAQVITCSVTSLDSGGSWMISEVYRVNHGPESRSLFKELIEVKVAMGRKPWLITGDCNVIRFSDERWGKEGLSCYEKEFVDCIQNLEVDDIAFTGCFHSWTNKQIGADFVSKKLDRVLANGDWLATFSNTAVEFLERGVSDHSSALVTIAKQISYGPKPFKYFNFWSDHKNFLQWVEEGWRTEVDGFSMFRFYSKLKSTKTVLKVKNRECFGALGLKVKQDRANLESAQAEFIASRGSAECQVQNSSNLIKMVKDEHGHSYHEFSEIKRLAISFYKNLLGHSSHDFPPEKAERVANLIKKKFSAGCVAKMEAVAPQIFSNTINVLN
ncbi:uncharacterized protein LOC133863345 [Alnus glutinosa]|uniref:uncharacterized protein LOC133863345 n=1 Tax=Alnus glutinosa TaxID=3517 RepID=UPI002D78379E|nr:uncharacterized protein LOC133863345 [Alnus glutinosa]